MYCRNGPTTVKKSQQRLLKLTVERLAAAIIAMAGIRFRYRATAFHGSHPSMGVWDGSAQKILKSWPTN